MGLQRRGRRAGRAGLAAYRPAVLQGNCAGKELRDKVPEG